MGWLPIWCISISTLMGTIDLVFGNIGKVEPMTSQLKALYAYH